jgi:hypothetical protein
MGSGLCLAATAALAAAALAGCGLRPEPQGDAGTARLVLDRAWIDTTAGAAPGSLRLWASGGTLVFASCAETPRVAAWRWTDSTTLAWDEDGAPVAAEVAMVGPEELVLALDLVGGSETRVYRLAGEGALC